MLWKQKKSDHPQNIVPIALLHGAVGISRKTVVFSQLCQDKMSASLHHCCTNRATVNRKNVPIISVCDTGMWASSPCLVALRESCKPHGASGCHLQKAASLPETASNQKAVTHSDIVKMEPIKALELEIPLPPSGKGFWGGFLALRDGDHPGRHSKLAQGSDVSVARCPARQLFRESFLTALGHVFLTKILQGCHNYTSSHMHS